jgi:hypothetical protein
MEDMTYTAKEILFPSHTIGLIVAHMWSYGLVEELKTLLFKVIKTLQLMATVRATWVFMCVELCCGQ